MKESPISALYDALLPSLKQHAPKDKTLELLKYYSDKIYQEGELNGRFNELSRLLGQSVRDDEGEYDLVEDGSDLKDQIMYRLAELESQLERKEQ